MESEFRSRCASTDQVTGSPNSLELSVAVAAQEPGIVVGSAPGRSRENSIGRRRSGTAEDECKRIGNLDPVEASTADGLIVGRWGWNRGQGSCGKL
ncbi:hypothetical protein Dda_7480 [Drechslerella dactyloides]|uniref:Uncharacterized protein n=1 Tax=Drechslerella dactyloides TaxID=74499 RepID=A0AAD6NGV5_DREDA|nr:hypothetical protein Dda_7480 [Drechslerella dactyloides]